MADSKSDLVLGIDEAGRGPILGPLVLAVVALRPRDAAALTRLGVTDSKRFGPGDRAHAARLALRPRILEIAAYAAVRVIDVAEVDRYTRGGGLNRLEQVHALALIVGAPPARRIVADGERLFAPLRARFPHLDALNHGEDEHVAVAAASILAKTRRDEVFARIAARYRPDFGPLGGGGYVNAKTKAFLRAYIARYAALPPEARRSWPWDFAADLLGPHFDRWAGEANEVPPPPQLSLL